MSDGFFFFFDLTKGSSCLIAVRRFVRELISNKNGSASVRDAERCLLKMLYGILL